MQEPFWDEGICWWELSHVLKPRAVDDVMEAVRAWILVTQVFFPKQKDVQSF